MNAFDKKYVLNAGDHTLLLVVIFTYIEQPRSHRALSFFSKMVASTGNEAATILLLYLQLADLTQLTDFESVIHPMILKTTR